LVKDDKFNSEVKRILEICTCRATRLGEFCGPPQGRSKLKEWEILPVRFCLNPEYISHTIDILKSVKNKTLSSLSSNQLPDYYLDTCDYIEQMEVDKYLIEISSLKFKCSQSNSGWSKFTKESFFNKINEIENICGDESVIYISAANVNFTNEHIKDFGSFGEKMFSNNRLRSRQQIDDWLMEHNKPTIYPSDILKKFNASEVFKAAKDLTHYSEKIEKYIRQRIEERLLKLL
jgi:hypothetical protein